MRGDPAQDRGARRALAGSGAPSGDGPPGAAALPSRVGLAGFACGAGERPRLPQRSPLAASLAALDVEQLFRVCGVFLVVVVAFNFYYNCRGHGGYSQSPRRRPLPGGPKEGGRLGPPDSCHHRGPESRGSLCGAGWALGRRRPPPCAGSRSRCVGPAAPSPVLGARCDDRRWRALGQEGSYFL